MSARAPDDPEPLVRSSRRAGLRSAARWLFSLLVLGVTIFVVDLGAIVQRIADVDLAWLLVALAISLPQIGLMAWRWHFTATRVGAKIRFSTAWREYYVSLLLNQLLPGGVVGDVARVVRQGGREDRPLARVASSVILERASGQVVLWLAVAATLPFLGSVAPTRPLVVVATGTLGALLVVVGLARWGPLRRSRIGRHLAGIERDLAAAFVSRGALGLQLGSSLLAFALLTLEFWACARAVGHPMTVGTAFLLVPWILVATSLPLTAGGWGVREAAAGAMFEMLGLSPSDAVAISIVFGIVALVSVLPGLPGLLARESPPPRPRDDPP